MTQRIDVRLDGEEVEEYRIQGKQIWLRTETHETIVRVPRANRATFWPRGARAVIHIGSLTISGPRFQMRELWDTICDTMPTT